MAVIKPKIGFLPFVDLIATNQSFPDPGGVRAQSKNSGE
jgi:hypothetical protein